MKIKHIWKVANYTLITGWMFWAAETIYFLITYGWHLRAINEAEKTCDGVASLMIIIGIALYAYVGIKMIDALFKD